LVNESLLVDAGAVTSTLSLEQQLAIDDVLLSHAHLDHVVELAFLVDNLCFLREKPLRVWAPAPVLESLRKHLFNNEIWPDFTRIPPNRPAILELKPLAPKVPCRIAGLEVSWARTTHPVFAAGYCLSTEKAGLLYSGDTSVTADLWQLGRACRNLAAVFVETSLPNRLQQLARESGHLTPALLADELGRLGRTDLAINVFHMKPQFIDEIMAELEALGNARLQVLRGGEEFIF
jgi:cAMP phosphodiesterase